MPDEKAPEFQYKWTQISAPVTLSGFMSWVDEAIQEASKHADHDMNLLVSDGAHDPKCVYCKKNEEMRKWRAENPDECW